jgi:hypothetical protein
MVSGLGTYMSGKRLCMNKEYLFLLILTFCLPLLQVAFFTSRKVQAMEELIWIFQKGFDVSGFMRNVSSYGCGF